MFRVRYLFVLDHHYVIEPGMPPLGGEPGATRIPPPAGPPPTPPFTVSVCDLIEPYAAEELDRYRPADATVYPTEDRGQRAPQGRAWMWVVVTVAVGAASGLGGWAVGRRRRRDDGAALL